MENYPEELKEKYEKLSPKLKEALSSPEVSGKVLEIGDRFKIPEEKIEDLSMLSGMVFIGALPLSDLPEELKTTLEIEEGVSQDLAQSLNSEVFSKYKDELEKIYEAEELKLEIKKTPEPKEFQEEKPAEKIEIKKDLLKKKGPDKYQESIEGAEEAERARIVKEGGKIKKIF